MKTILVVAVIVILICLIFGDGIRKIVQGIQSNGKGERIRKAEFGKTPKPTSPYETDPTKFGKYNKPRNQRRKD